MANFCQQCSLAYFGSDTRDLASDGYAPEAPTRPPKGGKWSALCEGCGFILVDRDGKRVDPENWKAPDEEGE